MSYLTHVDADARRFLRHYVNVRSHLVRGDQSVGVWTVDISGRGARIGLDSGAAKTYEGEGWELLIPEIGRYPVEQVWHRGTLVGFKFLIDEPSQQELAAQLPALFPMTRH